MVPPDVLEVEKCETLSASGVTLKEAPIETTGRIVTVERYHAPLRAALDKINNNLDRSTSDVKCL